MKEIVINNCFGGFGLSEEAVMRYAELKGIKLYVHVEHNIMKHYTTVPWEEYEALSKKCIESGEGYKELNDKDWYFSDNHISRDDPILIQVIRELGKKANDSHADLKIVEIPDGVEWKIEEYDGNEHVAEKHRMWS